MTSRGHSQKQLDYKILQHNRIPIDSIKEVPEAIEVEDSFILDYNIRSPKVKNQFDGFSYRNTDNRPSYPFSSLTNSIFTTEEKTFKPA